MANNGISSLEDARALAEESARALRDSLAQAHSIEQAAARLASGGSEQAALVEQTRAAIEGMASGIE